MHFILTFRRRLCDQSSHCDAASITVSCTVAVSAEAPPCVVTATIRAGLHVHCVLGFIGQSGAAIFQFRDLCFAIAGTFPVLVGSLLPALAVHPEQCGRVFGLDAFGFGKALRVGDGSPVSRRTIDFIAALASKVVESTPIVLPLTQTALSQTFQHQVKIR